MCMFTFFAMLVIWPSLCDFAVLNSPTNSLALVSLGPPCMIALCWFQMNQTMNTTMSKPSTAIYLVTTQNQSMNFMLFGVWSTTKVPWGLSPHWASWHKTKAWIVVVSIRWRIYVQSWMHNCTPKNLENIIKISVLKTFLDNCTLNWTRVQTI